MAKEGVVYIYTGILVSHEKERINAIFSNMDGPREHHSEISEVNIK